MIIDVRKDYGEVTPKYILEEDYGFYFEDGRFFKDGKKYKLVNMEHVNGFVISIKLRKLPERKKNLK